MTALFILMDGPNLGVLAALSFVYIILPLAALALLVYFFIKRRRKNNNN